MTTHVRITQLDGKLPNLALMRLSSWHKAQGHTVHFYRTPHRRLDEPTYEHVYGSAIFKFSDRQIEAFQREFPEAIIGGTGTTSRAQVEDIIGDHAGLDYEPWPDFTASIGFTQRGCRLSCKFCVVPGKEGKPRSVATIHDIWRGEPWPKRLHLLDNDFFGADGWQDRIAEIREGGFKVSFNQGINVRAMTPAVAAALASVQYRDDQFTRSRLYTAWDNLKDEAMFFRGVDMLEEAGVPPHHLMTFMLIGFDKRETWDRIWHRFNRMVERGIQPYPMVFDPTRTDLKRWQRWVVRGLYRHTSWAEYSTARVRHDTSHPDLFAKAEGTTP